MSCDVVIVGGGASGLMAASQIAQRGFKVVVLEKMSKCGRKVCITGKGRCNITNEREGDEFLERVCVNREFLRPSLELFSSSHLVELLTAYGLKVERERGGRIFPSSGKAQDVAATLINMARESGAEIICDAKVDFIDVDPKSVKVSAVEYIRKGTRERLECSKVVIATGGCSYPSTGSDGDGYGLAYELGHNIVSLRPSLTPLDIESKHLSEMEGTMLKNVSLALEIDGKRMREEFGELEFRDYALAGAISLKLSRDVVDGVLQGRDVAVVLDLKPALSIAKLKGRVARELEGDSGLNLLSLLRKLMPKAMVGAVRDQLGFKGQRGVATLSEKEIESLIMAVKNLRLPVLNYRGFKEAIVTAGGVDCSEVSPESMESKIIGGLYLIGELLDIDGNTGGYNLQIAFSTAYKMAHSL